jgi:hypothetical protein
VATPPRRRALAPPEPRLAAPHAPGPNARHYVHRIGPQEVLRRPPDLQARIPKPLPGYRRALEPDVRLARGERPLEFRQARPPRLAAAICRSHLSAAAGIPPLRFARGGVALGAGSHEQIARIAAVARACPTKRIAIEGHAADGSTHYNRWLSEERARAVADRLVAAGVHPRRLKPVGLADAEPRANPRFPRGRALNRRVEFVILP